MNVHKNARLTPRGREPLGGARTYADRRVGREDSALAFYESVRRDGVPVPVFHRKIELFAARANPLLRLIRGFGTLHLVYGAQTPTKYFRDRRIEGTDGAIGSAASGRGRS